MLQPWALLLFAVPAVFGLGQGPRAKTENGPVIGSYGTSYSGFKYLAFRGIPYAKPPVGENRFKEPQRLEDRWVGEWNAQSFGSACLQLNQFARVPLPNGTFEYGIEGDEDCLFINIFTQEGGPEKKNVVFMIHGGAFMFGSADMYGPEYLMDNDNIVYVTFHYRLGPLGFLTTGDRVIPGNNGLKDQVAALEWVHRNIQNFGGDPKKITISGLSAGGASVDFMYLTPRTKGLFQRGFSFSGTALAPWALVPSGVERTKKLAEGLGCPTEDSRSILKCLRRRPAKQIVNQVRSLLVWRFSPFAVFGPVVEVNASRPYIDQTPRAIIQQGLAHKLPWVSGVTTEDGLYPAADFITDESLLKEFNNEWERIAASFLALDSKFSQKSIQETVQKVRAYYFAENEISLSNRGELVRLFTDRFFTAGAVEAAKAREGSYLYQYGYQSSTSFAHTMSGTKESLGACHCDDFAHIFDFSVGKSHQTPRDREMAAVMNNIFVTFVTDGKVPVEYKWAPFASSNSVLKIRSPDDITVSSDPLVDLETMNALYAGPLSHDEL